jgi:hypothetical protein
VRHNRARGKHGILRMSEIVRAIADAGIEKDEIQRRLGMDSEELDRLSDMRGSPDMKSKDSFGKGWVPVAEAKTKAAQLVEKKDRAAKAATKK